MGRITGPKALSYGITGIIGRSSGLATDLRLASGTLYGLRYSTQHLRSFLGLQGDCFDRFIVRSKEIIESFRLILQLLSIRADNTAGKARYRTMEDIINHFKESVALHPKPNKVSDYYVESPKGVFGSILVNNGHLEPYRCAFRTPVGANMNLISNFSNNTSFADFVATFCSIDVVLGEIDRIKWTKDFSID